MIKAWSRQAAAILADMPGNRWHVDILAYGLEIIIGSLINLILIFILAFWLDTLWTTAFCLISYITFRRLCGGVHLETWTRCLCTGVFLMVGLGWLAGYTVSWAMLYSLSGLAFITGGYAVYKWVPAPGRKTIRDTDTISKQKLKALQVLLFWAVADIILSFLGYRHLALALVYGILASSFLITPWGYWVMQTLDNILNLLLRRRMLNV